MDAFILAGGRGARLGSDKTHLEVGGATVLERTRDQLAKVFDRVALVGGEAGTAARLGVGYIADEYPGAGPLAGIGAGLRHTRGEHAFFVACDLPFFSARLAGYLAAQAGAYDVVVPHYQGYYEPMHAVYGRRCRREIEAALAEGERRVSSFFGRVHCLPVPEEAIARFGHPRVLFFNINTQADLARARALAGPHREGRLSDGSWVPVVCVVGYSNTGKTRLVSRLVQELVRRGHRVATVKHAAGGFEFDREGSDTDQHFQAGAGAVVAVGPAGYGLIERAPPGQTSLAGAIARLRASDIVVAEGFKSEDWAKVAVLANGRGPVSTTGLLAVVGVGPAEVGVPRFEPGAEVSLAAHLESLLGLDGRE